VTPALTAAVAGSSGVGPGTAQSIVSGTLFAGSLAQASIGLTQGDYTGIIGLGITVGIGMAWSQSSTPAQGGNGVAQAPEGASDTASATKHSVDAMGRKEVDAARAAGYEPATNDMKVLHAASATPTDGSSPFRRRATIWWPTTPTASAQRV